MILDDSKNLREYAPLFCGVDPAPLFDWLAGCADVAAGTAAEFSGNKLVAKMLDLQTGNSSRWETHRDHVDLQYIIAGGEIIGWRPATGLVPVGAYSDSSDVQFYADAPSAADIRLSKGLFVFFFPGDGHKPCLSDSEHSHVLKVVVKIHRSLLAL